MGCARIAVVSGTANNMELCPSCGDFHDKLDEASGWCAQCAGVETSECLSCGRQYKKDQPHRKICGYCRNERWLAENADELEHLIIGGMHANAARQQTYDNHRPQCIVCGESSRGGKRAALFCARTAACRRFQLRFRRLRERLEGKQVDNPKKQALAQIRAEIYVERIHDE